MMANQIMGLQVFLDIVTVNLKFLCCMICRPSLPIFFGNLFDQNPLRNGLPTRLASS